MAKATISVGEKNNIFNPNEVTFEERQNELKKQKEYEETKQKRDKQSPFKRWTQFNLEQTEKMMVLQLKHPKAAAILSFFVDQMDEYNAVMCSYQVLQEILEVSKDTIRLNVKILKERGFICVLKSGTSNVYTVNDTVYWKSWGNNRKYSKFPANVVLALSEQEKNYQVSFDDLEHTKHKEISVKDKPTEREGTA